MVVFFSVGDTKLHGLLRGSLLLLPLIVNGRNASKVLSKRDAGRLISARSELTLSKRGDLELCKDCRTCFGVMVVLVGFSLEMGARIIIPMAEYCLSGLTCIEVTSKIARRKTESQEQ
jgi:hypothetical protein